MVKFTEVAFFHKPSRSLLVTDAVVYVDVDPPACIPDEVSCRFYALVSLCFASRRLVTDAMYVDTDPAACIPDNVSCC